MDFGGKVFIITGASSGIGAGAAEHLSKLNTKLVICGRNEENLNELVLKIKSAKCEVLPIVGDVNEENCRKKIIDATLEKFGKIDVLVNNAGVGKFGMVSEYPMEEFDKIINTNVRSVYHLTQLAIPHLVKTKGNIVNISSVASVRGGPNVSAYCMSKAALDHFTRVLALELGPRGVRVNSVNPGVVHTNFFATNLGMKDEIYDEFIKRNESMYPLRRVANVNDTSQAISYLACDKMSSFITGNFIFVDGGKHHVLQI